MAKKRLDLLLVERDFCESRALAQKLIRAGDVKVNQHIIDKPGTEISIEAIIEVAKKPPYVSRGGEKLAKALTFFSISVNQRICLDGGISTGGFTDCLLQSGASKVYGVDVGYGQVAWTLRQDERVVLKERTNFRHLTPKTLYGEEKMANFGVMDLSFISLKKVLESLWNLLVEPKEVILLIKPQFEVGRSRLGKNGVVRDSKDQADAIYQVLNEAQKQGWLYAGLTYSPIKGPAGNIEYLLWLKQTSEVSTPSLEQIQLLTQQTMQTLSHGIS